MLVDRRSGHVGSRLTLFAGKKSEFRYYKSHDSLYPSGVFDFDKTCLTVKASGTAKFVVSLERKKDSDTDKTFEFKAASGEERDQWVGVLQDIVRAKASNVFDLRFNTKKCYKKQSITAQEFIDTADNCDILLFRRHAFLCKMQRTLTSSEYDHVGMVVITEDDGERKVLLLESVYYDHGVRLLDLSDPESLRALVGSHTVLVYRKLTGVERDDAFIQDLSDAVSRVLHKKYGMNFFNFWRRSSNGMQIADDRKFHCAELVVKMYKMLGFVSDAKSSSR